MPSFFWLHILFFPNNIFFVCGLSPRDIFHRSGPPEKRHAASQGSITREADRCFVSVDYDRDLHLSPGVGEHFLQFLRVFIHIDIDGPLTVGCPSLAAEGSGIRAVNNDFICHDAVPPCRVTS